MNYFLILFVSAYLLGSIPLRSGGGQAYGRA